jgi:hypothetical protein
MRWTIHIYYFKPHFMIIELFNIFLTILEFSTSKETLKIIALRMSKFHQSIISIHWEVSILFDLILLNRAFLLEAQRNIKVVHKLNSFEEFTHHPPNKWFRYLIRKLYRTFLQIYKKKVNFLLSKCDTFYFAFS